MSTERQIERQRRRLVLEQALRGSEGIAMGWSDTDERGRLIVHAVAEAATQAGLGNIKVRDFNLRTCEGIHKGVKVTDLEHTHLSDFWRLVDDVRERTMRFELLDEHNLDRAIAETIAVKISGELDKLMDLRLQNATLPPVKP